MLGISFDKIGRDRRGSQRPRGEAPERALTRRLTPGLAPRSPDRPNRSPDRATFTDERSEREETWTTSPAGQARRSPGWAHPPLSRAQISCMSSGFR